MSTTTSKYAVRLGRLRKAAGSLALWTQEGDAASEDTMAACETLLPNVETLAEVLADGRTPDEPVFNADLFRDWTWLRESDWNT